MLDHQQLIVVERLYTIYGEGAEHKLLFDHGSGKWQLCLFDRRLGQWQVEYLDTFRRCLDVIQAYNAPAQHPF